MIERQAELRCRVCNRACDDPPTYVRRWDEERAEPTVVCYCCRLLYRATGRLPWYETAETEEADPEAPF